jgi:uncharacterized membrane protein
MTVVALVILIVVLVVALVVAARGRAVSVRWESRRVVWHCTGCGRAYRWEGGLEDATPCPGCGRVPSPAERAEVRRAWRRLDEEWRRLDAMFREDDHA